MKDLLKDLTLDFELVRILQMLQLTAPASAVVRAGRILPPRSGFQDLNQGTTDKDHLAIMPSKSGAAIHQLVDLDFEGGPRLAVTGLHKWKRLNSPISDQRWI